MFTTGFKTLLRLRVEHEYFAPGSVLAFGLEPLPPSARQLRASRLLWKRRENQWALVWEGRNGGFAGEDGPQRLRFAMSSAMPLWVNASDLPPFSANSEQLYIELDAAAGQERARAGAEHLFALERPRPMLELPPESPWRLLDLGGQELSRAPRGDGSLWMAPEEWGDGPFELWRGMELERRFLFAGQAASNRLGIMELRLPPWASCSNRPWSSSCASAPGRPSGATNCTARTPTGPDWPLRTRPESWPSPERTARGPADS